MTLSRRARRRLRGRERAAVRSHADGKNVWKLRYQDTYIEAGEYVAWEDASGGEVWFRPLNVWRTRGIGCRGVTIDDRQLRDILASVPIDVSGGLHEYRKRMVDVLNASGIRPTPRP